MPLLDQEGFGPMIRFNAWRLRRRRDALERAWQRHKRVTGLQHATRGDKIAFMREMQA
jgi:hypothetical protein